MERKTYTKEFKIEAVKLSDAEDVSVAQVAEELGIRPKLLYRWRSELRAEGEQAFPGQGKARDEEVAELKRELLRVRPGARHLKKSAERLCTTREKKYEFVKAHKDEYPITLMCSTLEVSTSGYYSWLNRKPSKRQQEDEELLEEISEIHEQSRETYGSLKIQKVLEQQGKRVGRNRILRLMRVGQLEAKRMRIIRPRTTAKSERPAAPNLLNQHFEATAINQIWLSDITYIRVQEEGWLYLAAVMDLFSRRIVGWSMDSQMPDSLTISALQMALQHRQPPKQYLMHHSDQGSQYTSDDYTHLLAHHEIDASNSRKGNCFDNAPMESFFSNLKLELIYHHDFTREQARRAIFEYIEVFYNRIRIHSATDYLAPATFEQRFHDQTILVPETLRV